MNILTKKNKKYKQKVNKFIAAMQLFETENIELNEQNMEYSARVKVLRLNEESLTKTCCQQTAELVKIRNNLRDIQGKYDKLYVQHTDIQQENEKLNEIITYKNNDNDNDNNDGQHRVSYSITPSADSSPRTSTRKSY
eukprot:UN10325